MDEDNPYSLSPSSYQIPGESIREVHSKRIVTVQDLLDAVEHVCKLDVEGIRFFSVRKIIQILSGENGTARRIQHGVKKFHYDLKKEMGNCLDIPLTKDQASTLANFTKTAAGERQAFIFPYLDFHVVEKVGAYLQTIANLQQKDGFLYPAELPRSVDIRVGSQQSCFTQLVYGMNALEESCKLAEADNNRPATENSLEMTARSSLRDKKGEAPLNERKRMKWYKEYCPYNDALSTCLDLLPQRVRDAEVETSFKSLMNHQFDLLERSRLFRKKRNPNRFLSHMQCATNILEHYPSYLLNQKEMS